MGIYIVHPGTGTIISATDEVYLVSVDVEGVDIDEDDDSALVEYAVAHGLLFDPVVLDRVWPLNPEGELPDWTEPRRCSLCNADISEYAEGLTRCAVCDEPCKVCGVGPGEPCLPDDEA